MPPIFSTNRPRFSLKPATIVLMACAPLLGGCDAESIIDTAEPESPLVSQMDTDGDGIYDQYDAQPLNPDIASLFAPTWDNPIDSKLTAPPAATSLPSASLIDNGDMDGDGDVDLVTWSIEKGAVAWYERTNDPAAPAFKEHIITNIFPEIFGSAPGSHLSVADLDGDADMDISLFVDRALYWYENMGGNVPQFSLNTITMNKSDLALLSAVTDINADGQEDILTFTYHDGANRYQFNGESIELTPDLTFYPQGGSSDLLFSNYGAYDIADVDNDGDADILVADHSYSYIKWFINNGAHNPAFSVSAVQGGSWDQTHGVEAADMDSDGDMDVVHPQFGPQIKWLENTGDLSTSSPEHLIDLPGGKHASSIEVLDLDGDGDMDILGFQPSADPVVGSIVWYENIQPETFVFSKHLLSPIVVSNAYKVEFNLLHLNSASGTQIQVNGLVDGHIALLGVAQAYYDVVEGSTFVGVESASDADVNRLRYSLGTGADAQLFSIDATTGELHFIVAPSFSTPSDANQDNHYHLTVRVTDGVNTLSRPISVSVRQH